MQYKELLEELNAKKAELEEAYRELQYRYNKLQSDTREEIKKLEFFRQIERKNAITDLEDKMYDKYISLSDRNFRVCGATNFSFLFHIK